MSREPVVPTEGGEVGSRPPHDRKRPLFWLILVALPLLPVILLEGYFYLRFRSEYPNSSLSVQGRYRFVPAPYRLYGNNPNYVIRRDGVTYRYNNCGFRDEEDLGAKQPNEFRVFLMGGSAAYGTEAWEMAQFRVISGQGAYPSSQTIAGHLQEFLQKRMPHRPVRVINAAVPNYSIQHVYLTYLTLIRLLAPDLIVTMDGWNEDFRSVNPYGRAVGANDKSGPEWTRVLRSHSYFMYYLGFVMAGFVGERNIVEVSDAEFDAMDAASIRQDVVRKLPDLAPRQEVLDELMKVYESFAHAAQLDSVPILFAVQPAPLVDSWKSLTPMEEKMIKYLSLKGFLEQSAALPYLAGRLAARAGRDQSFHFVDLLPVFRNFAPDAYTDYCHLTPVANRHLAERLAGYVLSVPEWTNRASARASPGPVTKERLGVDPSCGALR